MSKYVQISEEIRFKLESFETAAAAAAKKETQFSDDQARCRWRSPKTLVSPFTALKATPRKAQPPKRFIRSQIPDSILHDPSLNAAITLLPSNYHFEVHKCVWHVRSTNVTRVAAADIE